MSSKTQASDQDPVLFHRLRGLKAPISALAFSPATKLVAAASLDHSVFTWNFGSNDKDKTAIKYAGHSDGVLDLDFSGPGRLLASCSRDRTVRIWIASSTRCDSSVFRAHSAPVRSVEFSPFDSQKLITASDDKSIKFWTVNRHEFITSIAEHTNWVRSARYSPDGRMIASCSDDKTIRLFDERTGATIHVFGKEPKGFAQHIAFHPSGTCLGAGTSDNKVKIYDIRMQKLQQLYSSHEAPVTKVSFHASGNYIVSSSQDGSLRMFDLLEARPIYDLRGHNKPVNAVTFSPKGEYLASGGDDNVVFIWKTNIDEKDRGLRPNSAQQYEEKIQETKRELAKCDVLSEKMKNKENQAKGPATNSKPPPSTSKGDTEISTGKLLQENQELREENEQLKEELADTSMKVEALTETVILMEKRITLLEDQLKLSASMADISLGER
ncbi:hypothetical protein TCAL_08195 [Tigriopus californicus]|uniref:Uncharacterized protein n=1 Tax=Tigriopus californicus TaxID=6832 RepID=A0A553NBB2_TIGCA|nr:POC1 centriolar protein homolog A-like [Tigriopus californicus]TRY62723.1 hypothetical protein TCAL_08195 [Tigriopus californicus]